MKITTYGTRGSIPVAGKQFIKYGGNTTSLKVDSDCLPPKNHLAIDAGSGFVPLSMDILKDGGVEVIVNLFLSHLHHDHTQGLFLSPLTFIPSVGMRLYGLKEYSIGPREMMEAMMKPPFFPIHFKKIASHFKFKPFYYPDTSVVIFHPRGIKILQIEEFEKMENDGGHVPIGTHGKYPIEECLILKMYKSNHPEGTISYRFEERPTKKIFVFLTDHENQAGIPRELMKHLFGIDLLLIDCQYGQKKYDQETCGYGHGTGPYCAGLAVKCQVKRIGLTHHDPFASDTEIEKNLAEAKKTIKAFKDSTLKEIFACSDFQVLEV